MTDHYASLAAEIDRIVNSPYPTHLKHLQDILCLKCTAAELSRWVLAKPCQIEKLAGCVLDGLQQWPYVLEIMEKLSCEIKIRDELFRHEPRLLHDLVQESIRAHDVQSRYVTTAVSMLSHPLPEEIPMPSDVQSLFVQMFDYAAQQPNVASIKPLHEILRGTSTLLLGLLSSSVLIRLEEHLFSILRSIKGDNQSLSLYCLAIMQTISTASDDQLKLSASSYDTQELLASTQVSSSKWAPDAIRQFFSDSKAQKTLQLIVLRAMWACTTTTGEPFSERMESLVLANEVIAAVPIHLRETWRKANALVARKLEEKILAPGLETGLRFESLCFLMRLTEGGIQPVLAMDHLRQTITKMDTLKMCLCGGSQDSLKYLVYCGALDQSTTTALIQSVVDFMTSASAENLVESCEPLTQFLRHLSAGMPHQDSITEGTMLALDVLSCGQKLRLLEGLVIHPENDIYDDSRVTICKRALKNSRHGLVHELCKVFLTAALSSTQSTYSLAPETLSLLLMLHASSAQVSRPCSHVRRSKHDARQPLFFVETESTPEINEVNWRQELQAHCQGRAHAEQERLAAIFSKACSRLEERCEDIETPLRQEQEKRDALQRQYDDLHEAYANLENESIDRNIRFNALEMERDQCMNDLEAAREEVESVMQRATELEMNLRAATSRAEKTTEEAKTASEDAEMERAAALARKEEQVEDLQAQLQQSANELRNKTANLEEMRQDLNDAHNSIEAGKAELDQLNALNDKHKASIDEINTQNNQLSRSKEELETDLQSMRDELSTAVDAHELELGKLEEQSRHDLEMANRGHELKRSELERQHEATREALDQELRAARAEKHQAIEDHTAALEQRDLDISEKQKKIDRLNRKCEQKDKQIAEANAMRSNLMAAMGLNAATDQAKLPLRPSRFSAQTQQQNMDSQEDPSPPTPFSGDDVETQEPDARASFASNASSAESRSGPTPKRARPRRTTFKGPSPAKPRLSASAAPRSTRSSIAGHNTVKRQPLLSVSANRSHKVGVASKTPSKAGGMQVMDDLDESTFDGSELFAGTPGDEMLDLDRALDENLQSQF